MQTMDNIEDEIMPKWGVVAYFTAKEFARFNINSSAVPKIFTGGKMNVEMLIFNLINFDDSKIWRRNAIDYTTLLVPW